MTAPLTRKVAGKKFMWDGATYNTRDDAREAMQSYQQDGFEVHLALEEDKYFLYTRRLAAVQSSE